MPYPCYNPTLVLRELIKEQGYNPDPVTLSFSYSTGPMGDFPLGDTSGNQMTDPTSPAGPSFEAALQHKSPGDSALPKFSPHSKDPGF